MSATVFHGARVVDPSRGIDETGTVIVADGVIAAAGASALNQGAPDGSDIIDCRGRTVMPGLVDSRVFIGEPGGEHRETIESASCAAAAGGFQSGIANAGRTGAQVREVVPAGGHRDRGFLSIESHPVAGSAQYATQAGGTGRARFRWDHRAGQIGAVLGVQSHSRVTPRSSKIIRASHIPQTWAPDISVTLVRLLPQSALCRPVSVPAKLTRGYSVA